MVKQREKGDQVPEFERKYNQKLIKLIKKNVDETDQLKLPGTIVGDDRMHKQLAKFIESDNNRTVSDNDKVILDDPFKTRDEAFMKYKYRTKEFGASYEPYQTSN